MDIETLILRETTPDNEHDKFYAKALREVYEVYHGKDKEELLELQKHARELHRTRGGTHYIVASCMVLMELLKEL